MAAAAQHNSLVLACGALAREIVFLQKQTGAGFDLQCLPAGYHNAPAKIVPALKTVLDKRYHDYDDILIGYGDCGTGGGLDRLLQDYPKACRLPGAHCYAFFAGLSQFDDMMEEELGSFFLTDYLARHFTTLIVKGMGLDRYPDIKDMYFKHYKKLVYLVQDPERDLSDQAREAAEYLGLRYEERRTGYGLLGGAIEQAAKTGLQTKEASHVI